MFSKIQKYEVPPKPVIRTDNFGRGITTRLMMKRHLDDSRKNNLSFSSGASIPNSSIRNLKSSTLKVNYEDPRSCNSSMMSLSNMNVFKHENDDPNSSTRMTLLGDSPLQRMRESVRRSSLNCNRGNNDSSKHISASDSHKLSRRVSMRTDNMNLNGSRKPTQESLREAIKNSEQQVELIDVDELSNAERKNSNSMRRISPVRVSFESTAT